MKIILCLATLLIVATPVALAEDFAPPDLTIEPAKPVHARPAKPVPLGTPKSQWSAEEADKPAKSFGEISNGPCDGCKLSLRARQGPLYPNIGPSPLWDPGEPPPSEDEQ